jgi:hypothetical protein
MRRISLVLLSLFLLVAMTACGVEVPLPEERPHPEVVDLQITPAVAHWLPLVAGCAEGIPNFGVSTQVLPRAELSLAESDLVLRLGERLESDPFVAVMALEEIVIVAGSEVPVSVIGLASLQAIFTGTITHWGEVPEAEVVDGGWGQRIKPLSYPEGHEIEILFRRAYLEDEPFIIEPQVFSTIAFFEKLIKIHPYAIGYLLESQVPEGVRVLRITADDSVTSAQYVLAITDEAPTGGLKQLLLCLQNAQ